MGSVKLKINKYMIGFKTSTNLKFCYNGQRVPAQLRTTHNSWARHGVRTHPNTTEDVPHQPQRP